MDFHLSAHPPNSDDHGEIDPITGFPLAALREARGQDPETGSGGGSSAGPAILQRPVEANYTTTEAYNVVTEDQEDHTFSGIMFDVFARNDGATKYLPIEHVEITGIGVRGDLGRMRVFALDGSHKADDRWEDFELWRQVHAGVHEPSPNEFHVLPFFNPDSLPAPPLPWHERPGSSKGKGKVGARTWVDSDDEDDLVGLELTETERQLLRARAGGAAASTSGAGRPLSPSSLPPGKGGMGMWRGGGGAEDPPGPPTPQPLLLKPGKTAGIYVHSAGPPPAKGKPDLANRGQRGWFGFGPPDSIVYNNQRHHSITMQSDHIRVLPGRAHTSERPFSQDGFWSYGNAWRPHREFVGRIEYGVKWTLWNPETDTHSRFPRSFRRMVRTLLLVHRRDPEDLQRPAVNLAAPLFAAGKNYCEVTGSLSAPHPKSVWDGGIGGIGGFALTAAASVRGPIVPFDDHVNLNQLDVVATTRHDDRPLKRPSPEPRTPSKRRREETGLSSSSGRNKTGGDDDVEMLGGTVVSGGAVASNNFLHDIADGTSGPTAQADPSGHDGTTPQPRKACLQDLPIDAIFYILNMCRWDWAYPVATTAAREREERQRDEDIDRLSEEVHHAEIPGGLAGETPAEEDPGGEEAPEVVDTMELLRQDARVDDTERVDRMLAAGIMLDAAEEDADARDDPAKICWRHDRFGSVTMGGPEIGPPVKGHGGMRGMYRVVYADDSDDSADEELPEAQPVGENGVGAGAQGGEDQGDDVVHGEDDEEEEEDDDDDDELYGPGNVIGRAGEIRAVSQQQHPLRDLVDIDSDENMEDVNNPSGPSTDLRTGGAGRRRPVALAPAPTCSSGGGAASSSSAAPSGGGSSFLRPTATDLDVSSFHRTITGFVASIAAPAEHGGLHRPSRPGRENIEEVDDLDRLFSLSSAHDQPSGVGGAPSSTGGAHGAPDRRPDDGLFQSCSSPEDRE